MGYLASDGSHLVQAPVSQGAGGIWQATVPATSLSGSATSTGLAEAVSAEYIAQADTRTVSISSSFDPTTYKGSMGVPAPNVAASDGSMSGDTYESMPFSVTYTANCSPGWFGDDNLDSYFLWYSSLNASFESGGFNPNAIDPFVCSYNKGQIYGTGPYATDHVYIHLTDSNDGANGTANYYMRLHNQWENVQTLATNQVDGPWQMVSGVSRQGPATGTLNIPITLSTTFDDSESSNAAVGNPTNPPTNVIFEYCVNDVDWPYTGNAFETPVGGTFPATIPANQYYWVERCAVYTQQTGTIDNYGPRGYLGMSNWIANTIDDSGMTQGSDGAYILPPSHYITQVQTSPTPPTN